ncbi:phosphate system positive regulatory protein pho81 [Purpureocillium takamizusanense]|uniref:Phosphate system positive regulatory protein pho81 n=1 Tax=Purpureocillium takamizusanense TaxID=2060973 RepID=A0A9Q8QEX8_9HYPO|nr:phosphate system positive regulatory protein pho81 [Purpureocillium takamizusanense]UNI17671.1 phosphate system positive regulatory protein pho81 [Purpureocillium takamizusanense]
MNSSLPQDMISRLPPEIIGLIIVELTPKPLSSHKDSIHEPPDENSSDDDLAETELEFSMRTGQALVNPLRREEVQRLHRRTLLTLAQVRPFRREAERALWMAHAPVALLHAVCTDNESLAEYCFNTVPRARLKLNCRFRHGYELKRGTILHVAVMVGSSNLVRLLLSHGADIEARGHFVPGHPPLGQFFEISLRTKITPLGLSLVLGNTKVSNLLLDCGASHQVGFPVPIPGMPETAVGFRALHAASMAPDRGTLARLLQTPSLELDDFSQDSMTPLHWTMFQAVRLDHLRMLLQAGANPVMDPLATEPVLHFLAHVCATKDELVAIVQLLVEHGVDINGRDEDDHTALVHAIRELNVPCVQALVESGAEVNHDGAAENSPMAWCLSMHRAHNSGMFYTETVTIKTLTIIKLLLEHGIDYDPKMLFACILFANIGEDAKDLLMSLASQFVLSTAELAYVFVYVGCQPSFWPNKALDFLLDNFIPTEGKALDDCDLFRRLLGTPAVANPNFHRLMGPGLDVNSPLQGPDRDLELSLPPILAVTGSEHYVHETSRHTLEALIHRGANIQATDEHGKNCLLAYITSHFRTRNVLSERDPPDNTISFWAFVRMLAKHGFDFTSADNEGYTALHLIAISCDADLHASSAELLIQLGANAAQRNNTGLTPIEMYMAALVAYGHYIDGSYGRALAKALPEEERAQVTTMLANFHALAAAHRTPFVGVEVELEV